MEYQDREHDCKEKKSSATAKAGLALGIVGTSLAALDWIREGRLGGRGEGEGYGRERGGYERGFGCEPAIVHVPAASERDLCYVKELACKEDEIVKLKAEKYADACDDKIYEKIAKQEKELCDLRLHVVRLQDKEAYDYELLKRDVGDVYKYADCTFEKKHCGREGREFPKVPGTDGVFVPVKVEPVTMSVTGTVTGTIPAV